MRGLVLGMGKEGAGVVEGLGGKEGEVVVSGGIEGVEEVEEEKEGLVEVEEGETERTGLGI